MPNNKNRQSLSAQVAFRVSDADFIDLLEDAKKQNTIPNALARKYVLSRRSTDEFVGQADQKIHELNKEIDRLEINLHRRDVEIKALMQINHDHEIEKEKLGWQAWFYKRATFCFLTLSIVLAAMVLILLVFPDAIPVSASDNKTEVRRQC